LTIQSPKFRRQIFDISPPINNRLAVFPGDVPFEKRISLDFKNGNHLSLSSIQTTLHIGAHADAPSHYHQDGVSIDQCSLETYLGDCQVIDVTHCRGAVNPSDLSGVTISAPRILFKSHSLRDLSVWQDEFTHLSVETIDWLSQKGVVLIGIDTPSMDHSNSKTLDAHQTFYKNRIAILEGLTLERVPSGRYQLIALPLKLEGAEASPVRAILMTGESL
jgi:arylformamidase